MQRSTGVLNLLHSLRKFIHCPPHVILGMTNFLTANRLLIGLSLYTTAMRVNCRLARSRAFFLPCTCPDRTALGVVEILTPSVLNSFRHFPSCGTSFSTFARSVQRFVKAKFLLGVAHADQHAELRLQRGSLRGRHRPLQVQGLDRGLATGRVS